MAYDPDGRRVFLFGGMHSPPVTLLCDTWTYDGRWTRVFDEACMTDCVRNASLAYDAKQRAMLLVERARDHRRCAAAIASVAMDRTRGRSSTAMVRAARVSRASSTTNGAPRSSFRYSSARWSQEAHGESARPAARAGVTFVNDARNERLL